MSNEWRILPKKLLTRYSTFVGYQKQTVMKSIKTTITIAAPTEKVWQVFYDFAKYPEWNPLITKAEGTGELGTRLRNTLSVPGQKPQVFKPKVLVNEPHKEFRWLGSFVIPGVFDGEHYFQFSETPEGHTLLTHGENFSGILSGFIMKKIGDATHQGFLAMNEALAKRVAEV